MKLKYRKVFIGNTSILVMLEILMLFCSNFIANFNWNRPSIVEEMMKTYWHIFPRTMHDAI